MRSAIARRLFYAVFPAGLALLTLFVALAFEARLLTYSLAVTTMAVILWRWRLRAGGPAFLGPRIVLALTVLVEQFTAVGGSDWLLLLAGLGVVGLIGQEGLVARVSRPLFRTANIESPLNALSRHINQQTAYVANAALLSAFIISGLVPWPSWVMFAAVLVVVSVDLAALALAVRQRLNGRERVLTGLRQTITEHQPRFMLYFTAPLGSNYQIMMWLPHLEQLNERFIIVLRELSSFRVVATATDVPVLYCPEMSTFDACVVDSLEAVFYVNNSAKNLHSVRYGQLTHIFLNHGDSDKVSSFNPVTAMYDKVLVAGQAGIDRYLANGVDIPLHKFGIVGRPQVATVTTASKPVKDIDQPVVLYAPTWTGYYADANYSSLSMAPNIVRAMLARGATVILRHHPYTLRNRVAAAHLRTAQQILAADQAETGRPHVWGDAATVERSLIDCFNQSDALITDVSSVASEYLYSEKPFAITDMQGLGDEFAEVFSLASVGYVIERDGANIDDILDQVLKSDPLQENRRAARVYYLGDFPRETYAEAFLREARQYI